MRKYYKIIFILLLQIGNIIAQEQNQINTETKIDSNTTIPFIAYWNLGECHKIEIIKQKRKIENDLVKEDNTSRMVCNLSVIDSTDKSYKIEWSPISLESNRDISDLNIDESIIQDLSNMTVVYSTDEVGIFNKLENVENIKIGIITLLDSLKSNLEEKNSKQNFDVLFQMLKSDQFINQKLSETMMLYHLIHGYEYPINKEIEYEDYFPNLIGGDPIPANGVAKIVSIDSINHTFSYYDELEPDREAYKKFMISFFQKAGISEIANFDDELKKYSFMMKDTKQYIADYESGWILSMESLRKIRIGPVTQEHLIKIKHID